MTTMQMPSSEQMLATINRWVEVESKTEDVAAVNRMMGLAEEACQLAGLTSQRLRTPEGYGDCLLAHAADDDGETHGILVLAHLDTVHPAGTLAMNPIRTEGDRAYGPGIYDMKASAYMTTVAWGGGWPDEAAGAVAVCVRGRDRESGIAGGDTGPGTTGEVFVGRRARPRGGQCGHRAQGHHPHENDGARSAIAFGR